MTEPYYSDERVTLYHGDCLDIIPTLDESSVDALVTDPPFSSGGRRENSRSLRKSMTRSVEDVEWISGDAMSTGGFVWMIRALAARSRPILRDGAHILAFIDWRMHGNLSGAIESADYRQHPTLVWDKDRLGMGSLFRNQHEWIVHFSKGNPAAPNRRDVGNVLRHAPVRYGDHPTEKPTGLMERLITVVAPDGGTVLDPFAGSGPTLIAAKATSRNAIGVEIDERYCEVIAKRLSQDCLDLGSLA